MTSMRPRLLINRPQPNHIGLRLFVRPQSKFLPKHEIRIVPMPLEARAWMADCQCAAGDDDYGAFEEHEGDLFVEEAAVEAFA